MNKELFQKLIKKINIEVAVLLLWLVMVGLIFIIIPSLQTAGLVAGAGFVIIPLWLVFRLLKQPSSLIKNIRLCAISVFFLLSSLPIIGLRLFNLGLDFNELTLFGILTGRQIHQISNYTYLLMVLSFVLIKHKKTEI